MITVRAFRGVCACAIATIATSSVSAQSLIVGDKAPPLSIEKWIKGAAVGSFEPGKTYVIDFWAMSCPPSVDLIPHLSELARAYKSKGLTIIGCIAADNALNGRDRVETAVKEWGDDMDYTVAWDREHATSISYLAAAGIDTIPMCFAIDQKGNIAYIGPPAFLDLVLEPLTAGTWDVEKGNSLIRRASVALNNVFSNMKESPKEALAALKQFESEYPALNHVIVDRKFDIHVAADDYDGAYEFASRKVDEAIKAKKATELNNIAWAIVDPFGKVRQKNADLALRASLKAVELGDGIDYLHLDTLARAYFVKGDVEKAIETQEKAFKLAPKRDKDEMEWPLVEYRKAKR